MIVEAGFDSADAAKTAASTPPGDVLTKVVDKTVVIILDLNGDKGLEQKLLDTLK